jgi:uncharacterized protein (TIGR02246 family)
VEKDKKSVRPFGTAPAVEAEDAIPSVGPYNPALAEIYQRLYPEMKRPKPNQEAIAAALQAMQRLTMKMDSEAAAEETTPRTAESPMVACAVCGHHNRDGNKFCGMCGLPVDGAVAAAGSTAVPPGAAPVASESRAVSSAHLELPDFAKDLVQSSVVQSSPPPTEAATEVHAPVNSPQGPHHYHHHYHHHFFPGGIESPAGAPVRTALPESAREADRLRMSAAAKGENMSRSEAAVRRLTQEWVLACNTRHLDELLELYAPDALVMRSNLPLLRGAAAVREFFFTALESGLGEVSVEPIRVEVVGDLAHEVGRYSALVPGTTGKRREERGKYLWVFAKQGGGEWKLVSECWSADLTLTNAESDVPKAPMSVAKPQLRRT